MLLWNLRILAQIAICHELRVFCAILGGIFFVCAILYAFSISVLLLDHHHHKIMQIGNKPSTPCECKYLLLTSGILSKTAGASVNIVVRNNCAVLLPIAILCHNLWTG